VCVVCRRERDRERERSSISHLDEKQHLPMGVWVQLFAGNPPRLTGNQRGTDKAQEQETP